ncbi:MAG: hypothetical protein HC809_13215, partial [Gammaproteobacteria bacterium]|nr:hypothetical protein [Gammaproteobacteria bacterium]
AGNLLVKSLKGALIIALDLDIRTSVMASFGSTTVTVLVSNFASLEGPVLTIDLGDGNTQVLALTDAFGNPVLA